MNFTNWFLFSLIVANWLAISQGFGLLRDDFSPAYDPNCLVYSNNIAESSSNYNEEKNQNYIDKMEISHMNNLAIAHDDQNYKNQKTEVMHINHNGRYQNGNLPQDSKENVYVFLKKGQTHYLPLNADDQAKISHFPMNVNGVDVNLPDKHILKEFGILKNIRNHKENHFPNQNNINKKPNYENSKQEFLGSHHNRVKYNNLPNKYQNNEKNIQNLKKRGCKTQDIDRQQQLSFNNQKNKNHNKIVIQNTAIEHQNNYHIAFSHPSTLIKDEIQQENYKTENPDIVENSFKEKENEENSEKSQFDETLSSSRTKEETIQSQEILNEQTDEILGVTLNPNTKTFSNTNINNNASPQDEVSYTTIHEGTVQVSKANTNSNFEYNREIEKSNDDYEKEIFDTPTNEELPSTKTFKNKPKSYTDLTTDSPTRFISPIKSNKSRVSNKNIKSEVKFNRKQIEDQSNVSKEILPPNLTTVKNSIEYNDMDETTPVMDIISQTHQNNDNEIMTTVKTIIDLEDISYDSFTDDINANSDLKPSENRLYAYVTKFDKKSRKPTSQKSQFIYGKLQGKYLDPLAYEAIEMKPHLESLKINSKNNKKQSPKAKRYAPNRPFFLSHTVSKGFKKNTEHPTEDSYNSKPSDSQQWSNQFNDDGNNLCNEDNNNNFIVGSGQKNGFQNFLNIFRKPNTQRDSPLVGNSNMFNFNKNTLCENDNEKKNDQMLGSPRQGGYEEKFSKKFGQFQTFSKGNGDFSTDTYNNFNSNYNDDDCNEYNNDNDNKGDDRMLGSPHGMDQFTDRTGNITPANPEALNQLC